MKKTNVLLTLSLCLGLLAGCTAPNPGGGAPQPGGVTPDAGSPPPTVETAQPAATPESFTLTRCRIVDGAEEGKLLLAGEEDDQVYLLDVEGLAVVMDGGSSGASALKDGMLVDVGHNGTILETYPAQFASVSSIAGDSGSVNDLCGLYLQVLDDLWDVDSGLNDGITQLGVDFSALEGLTESEKSALGYAFGQAHGMMPVTGTWDELRDGGYFTGDPLGDSAPEGARFWHWEEGCLFTIEGSAESFTAEKWRSSLGAYFYGDCTAMEKDGAWTYEIGSEVIA